MLKDKAGVLLLLCLLLCNHVHCVLTYQACQDTDLHLKELNWFMIRAWKWGGGWGAASMIYTARARCVQMWRNWSHITFLSFTRCPQPHSLVAVTISTLLLPFKRFVWCGTSLSVWELIFESTNNPWVSTESSVLRILHKRFAHGKCATFWIGCAVFSQWAALVMKKARWWRWNLIIKGVLLSFELQILCSYYLENSWLNY